MGNRRAHRSDHGDLQFSDSTGTTWTVQEVRASRAADNADASPRTVGASAALYFFSRFERRKLVDYPATWRTLPITELELHCERASWLSGSRQLSQLGDQEAERVIVDERSGRGDRAARGERVHRERIERVDARESTAER